MRPVGLFPAVLKRALAVLNSRDSLDGGRAKERGRERGTEGLSCECLCECVCVCVCVCICGFYRSINSFRLACVFISCWTFIPVRASSSSPCWYPAALLHLLHLYSAFSPRSE